MAAMVSVHCPWVYRLCKCSVLTINSLADALLVEYTVQIQNRLLTPVKVHGGIQVRHPDGFASREKDREQFLLKSIPFDGLGEFPNGLGEVHLLEWCSRTMTGKN